MIIPVWAIRLGRTICDNENFDFPFEFFLIDNFLMAIPFGIGLLIQYCAPGLKQCSKQLGFGFSISYIVGVIILGVWQSYDIFLYLPFELQWKVSVQFNLNSFHIKNQSYTFTDNISWISYTGDGVFDGLVYFNVVENGS